MTGPASSIRRIVAARAEDCCEICGAWAVAAQIHHRKPRGIGGSSDPEINTPANLLHLCFSCHRWIETTERASAYASGWLVPRGHRPDAWPVHVAGAWVLLTDTGHYQPTTGRTS